MCGAAESMVELRTTWPEHRYPGEFVLRRCDACGLLFNAPRLQDAALARLYDAGYYFFNRDDARELSRIVAMHARTVAMIAPPAPGDILDIGCGRGYFPALLRALGFACAGVEISDDAAADARDRLGVDVFAGTIEQYVAAPQARAWSCVTAIDVLEHVPDPRAFAAALARATRPGGLLIVDTPNAASANRASLGRAWNGYNPFHIHLFDPSTLGALLGAAGFDAQACFTYHNRPARVPGARRAAIGALRGAGLLGPLARAYFRWKGARARRASRVAPLIAQAAETARRQRPWRLTPDASAPLARDLRGDNVVVIARRVGSD